MIIIASFYAILFPHFSLDKYWLGLKMIQRGDTHYFANSLDKRNVCYDGEVRLPSCNITEMKLVKMKGIKV